MSDYWQNRGMKQVSLHDKLKYLLDIKHFSLEEGSDAHVELFRLLNEDVLPELVRAERMAAQLDDLDIEEI